MTGMADLGHAILDGRADFVATVTMLTSTHSRLFGTPPDVAALEQRIARQLIEACPQTALAAQAVTHGLLEQHEAALIIANHVMSHISEPSEGQAFEAFVNENRDLERERELYRDEIMFKVAYRLDVFEQKLSGTEQENGLGR